MQATSTSILDRPNFTNLLVSNASTIKSSLNMKIVHFVKWIKRFCKSIFDIDARIELNKSFVETIIDDIETEIKKICNVEIYKSKRNPGEYEMKMNYSFRSHL